MRLFAGVPIASLAFAACGGAPGNREGADAAAAPSGIAPDGSVDGEIPAGASNDVDVPPGGAAIYRVEAVPGEHVAFRLDFPAAQQGAVLAVMRWDGERPVNLGKTDAGAGLRVLAVVDQEGPRTFWAQVEAQGDAITGTLTVSRTPFTEGIHCSDDCDHLLQLPLPNDPARDGYDISEAVCRYQFGRRDLVMFLREAGRRMFAAGETPFRPADLSDWEGRTPGMDVGAPRHVSHQHGKDVDLSLYGTDGLAPWRSYCVTQPVSGGRECTPGSVTLFDGYHNAQLIGVFFASERVTTSFLDRELIAVLGFGAERAVADGVVPAALLPLYADGVHVQHWPNQDNHVHVRVSESTAGRMAQPMREAP